MDRHDRNRRRGQDGESRGFFDGTSSKTYERRRRRSPKQNSDESSVPDSPGLSRKVAGPIQLLTRQRDDEPASTSNQPSPRPEEKEPARAKPAESRSFQLATRQVASGNERKDVRPSEAPQMTSKSSEPMKDGVKFVNDTMDLVENIVEFLKPNPNFKVVSAIGSQTAGKSTILSMIGGNESQDMYRQYIFRPASREAVETSKHQTLRLQIFVTKFRMILIDCQPLNSAAIIDEALVFSRQSKFSDNGDNGSYVEALQLTAFLFQISHTVLVCMDHMIDLSLIKSIRLAEMLRANVDNIAIPGLANLDPHRKVNLVFLHTKAKAPDFAKVVVRERALLLKAMFSDSRRFWISSDETKILFPLADIKPRKESSGAKPTDTETTLVESQQIEDFDVSTNRIRQLLMKLPAHAFTTSPDTAAIDELKWFIMAKQIWKEPTFVRTTEALGKFLRTDEMNVAVQMENFSLQPKNYSMKR
ncbi:hypothetical protein WR25_15330 [Diploscapter pachys]|uniref:Protein SMG9 n=1 Tax=Diploscapter pachys TaxID=2018661 RepID=A0A2A2KLA5_9BILA|nr:hypothetical protein WR25_15330 [Diploscapter pachys]